MDDTQKYKVISLLQLDKPPKDIAEELDVSYSSVLKLRRDFEQARINGTVDSLLDSTKVVLDVVKEQVSNIPETMEAVEELKKGLDGLEHLSEELQNTASLINNRAKSLILSIENVSELEIITDIVCKLQTSFLNKNMTQVNVQNNFGDESTNKYGGLLGDRPGG